MGLIYEAIFPNGKKYVGQTLRTLEVRKQEHIFDAENGSNLSIFHKAIVKYGSDDILWIVLEDGIDSREKLNEREVYWISRENSHYKNGFGYNMNDGGNARDNLCLIEADSEEARQIYEDYKQTGSTVKTGKKFGYKNRAIITLLEKIDPDWKKYSKIGRGHVSVLSASDEEEIYRLYRHNGRIDDIAKLFNVARSTIASALKRIDPEYKKYQRYDKFSPEEKEEIISFYEDGNTIRATAKKFNVSWDTINRVIQSYSLN